MGSALADTLIAKGFDITVWNRTPAKAERFEAAGVRVAASTVEAVAASDVLVVCLFGHAAVASVVMTDDVARELRGKTLINLGYQDPDEVATLGQWVESHGCAFLKGSILVYPDDVRAGNAPILYGGSRQIFEAVQAVLSAMGGNPIHVADNPSGVMNAARAYSCFLVPTLITFVHGAAICHRSGYSIEVYTRDLVLPLVQGPGLTGFLKRLSEACAQRRYDQDVQATLADWASDFRPWVDRMEADGVRLDLIRAIGDIYRDTLARGHAQHDLASIFETMVAGRPSG